MTTIYRIDDVPYCKIVLHASKYYWADINGVLIGRVKGDTVHIVDAIPLLHGNISVAPMLESALIQVDEFCAQARPPMSIVGYYQGNERQDDVELSTLGRRIADRIQSYSPPACVLMINAKKMSKPSEGSALDLLVRDMSTSTWRRVKPVTAVLELASSASPEHASNLFKGGLASKLTDFDDHLESPKSDWFNPTLINTQLY
mmetsp:Transcript_36805/g.59514  ORF Transcript_36805/g.59514 Transcript_36805/m.59514 type:complete len:202 (+) Transcript_36805:214-819(+)|eukprot:CAMPEP_0184643484 /NCGR_PEP_ID=MMETSP0308-20130426/338_1 /TAXON_ID=38269 /ORGANISM="Gloeochaete witrockiana, Strain SAG 46.84" /LENGTH=201 /DNA_ID=CAMNT_0027071457 /DNA_START=195 /DNA_END=800 /DNA_ORIENTATION=+